MLVSSVWLWLQSLLSLLLVSVCLTCPALVQWPLRRPGCPYSEVLVVGAVIPGVGLVAVPSMSYSTIWPWSVGLGATSFVPLCSSSSRASEKNTPLENKPCGSFKLSDHRIGGRRAASGRWIAGAKARPEGWCLFVCLQTPVWYKTGNNDHDQRFYTHVFVPTTIIYAYNQNYDYDHDQKYTRQEIVTTTRNMFNAASPTWGS